MKVNSFEDSYTFCSECMELHKMFYCFVYQDLELEVK